MTNWDDVRYLLALSRAGSLAGAARVLAVDHTTVGRRVEALEVALGVRLFVRSPTGYALTDEGKALVPDVARVEDAIHAFERASSGKDARLTGTVRVTLAEAFGSWFLAPRLAALTERLPGVALEYVTAVRAFDLSKREADLAIRYFKSTHADLVVRKIGDIGWSLYYSRAYAARRGHPRGEGDLPLHDRIALESAGAPPIEHAWMATVCKDARCVLRTNSTASMLGAARAGLGVALLPCFLGGAEPELERLRLAGEPRRGIWLTVHEDLQHAPRVRGVMELVADVVRDHKVMLRGD